MNIKSICFSFIFIFFISFNALAQMECPIIPLPNNYESTEEAFLLNKNTSIIIIDSSLHSLAVYLRHSIESCNGLTFKIGDKGKSSSIFLEKIDGDSSSEAYSLNMNQKSIVISSAAKEGLFDGIISLLQLIKQSPVDKAGTAIHCWNIQDSAKYKWRGLMLDESRHFFGKKMVKMILDWMAFYKLNRFHWHLTDEPG